MKSPPICLLHTPTQNFQGSLRVSWRLIDTYILEVKWNDNCENNKKFLFPFNERLGLLFLPFTERSLPLNGGNQILGGKWEEERHLATHLLKP